MAGLYEELGIKPVINASATLTKLGGSRMPPEVVDAMRAAAHSFVDLYELQERVGARIAELTQQRGCLRRVRRGRGHHARRRLLHRRRRSRPTPSLSPSWTG